nr:hypothetical protein [Tanacetum cinerariifolium]
MGSFIKWFCKRIGNEKLSKSDLEGPSFKIVKAFHENSISLQFQVKECHRLLTDQVDLVNPKGHRLVPDVSKPLPLGGPPGQLKAANYPDCGLEELVPSLWIESKCDYNISAAYSITHFYITRHSAPSDRRAVGSHMRILSVISIKTFKRYGYAFLREIVIRRADYNEYKISNDDFKIYKFYLYNAINLWIRNFVIRQHVGDLQLGIESYQTKLNLTEPRWDATDFLFKEDYTIVSKPMAVIYRDKNDQKNMLRENETLDNTTHNLGSMVFTLEIWDLPHKINQTVNEVFKEAVHVAFQALLRDRIRELPEADTKEILHQRMFESGSYKSLHEYVALYESLEASMEQVNRCEFLAERDKSRKRRPDDQDPPPPPSDSDLSKKKRHNFDALGSK